MTKSQERPPSDPSELTTAQILREVSILRELMESKHAGANHLVDQRFDAVLKQFDLVERMRVELKNDTEKSVAAALIAQKEAVKEQTIASGLATSKSEIGMTEQLKQQGATFAAAIKGLTDQVNDLKDLVARMDSARLGGEGAVNIRRLETGQILSVLGFVAAAIAVAYNIIRG